MVYAKRKYLAVVPKFPVASIDVTYNCCIHSASAIAIKFKAPYLCLRGPKRAEPPKGAWGP